MTKVKCDNDLLARLKVADPVYIDGLVDIVTDFGAGRAALSADIKNVLVRAKNRLSATRYDEKTLALLIKEVQEFGGHSALNVMRKLFSKPMIPYDEIVTDVHERLDGENSKLKTIADKEREIALALFGENWRELSFQERYDRCDLKKIVSGAFSIKNAAVFVGTRVVMGLPLTLGALATSPAYRVTVPFVAQMGWIRLKQENATEREKEQRNQESGLALLSDDSTTLLQITDDKDNPVLVLSRLSSANHLEKLKTKPLPQQQINTLSAFLGVIPSASILAEVKQSTYLLCDIPFEELVGSRSVEGAVRGFKMGAKGIDSHVNLTLPSELSSMAMAGTLWAAVSVAVAQKHLHDINEKLNDIIDKLDGIKHELEAQQQDKLNGLMSYVQELLNSGYERQISPAEINALEASLINIATFESYFQRKANEEIQKVQELKTDGWFSNDKAREDNRQSLQAFDNWVTGYLKTKQLKIVVAALLYRGSGYENAKYAQVAKQSLEEIPSIRTSVVEAAGHYKANLELSNSIMSSVSQELRHEIDKSVASIKKNIRVSSKDSQTLYHQFFEKPDQKVLLNIDSGRVIDAQLVLN